MAALKNKTSLKDTHDVQRLGTQLQQHAATGQPDNHDRPELPHGGGAGDHPGSAEEGCQPEGSRGAESAVSSHSSNLFCSFRSELYAYLSWFQLN